MCLALLELFGGIFCLSCHTAIGLGLLQVHRFSLRMVQVTATDVTSNLTPQGGAGHYGQALQSYLYEKNGEQVSTINTSHDSETRLSE